LVIELPMAAPGYWKGNRAGGGAALPTSVTSNAKGGWVVLKKGVRKTTTLLAGCALLLASTVTASDDARDSPYFMMPQQDLIDNLGQVLAARSQLESCEQQQQEALQRFLALGVPFQSAIFMAANQFPCGATDR
jgi:hypothetical protein